jgi:hypothetical protein
MEMNEHNHESNDSDVMYDTDDTDNTDDTDTYSISKYTLDKLQWKQCKTYEDVRLTMLEFLKGNINWAPTHYGPLLDKDPIYKQKLIQLNSLGVISINGQEYIKEQTINSQFMQREYVVFGYKLKINESITNVLTKFNEADFFYQALDYNTNTYYQTNTLDTIDFDNPEFWVTKTKNYDTQTTDNHTHLVCPEDIANVFNEYQKIVNNFHDDVIIFEVWSKSWKRPKNGIYLLDKIINCFN